MGIRSRFVCNNQMSDSNSENRGFKLSIWFVRFFAITAFCVLAVLDSTGMFLMIGLGLLFAIFVWMILKADQDRLQYQVIKKSEAEAEAQLRAMENLNAQLNKADFSSRLASFLASKESGDVPIDEPVSKMKFWQLSDDYERTPSRPVELLRYLLQRISKLVGQR